MSTPLTRLRVAEELLTSVRVGSLQAAASARPSWREHLFRGFRPNKISRSTALSRTTWFASDSKYLVQLLDIYLDDLSIPGAFGERLTAAAKNARVPLGLREVLAEVESLGNLSRLPSGIAVIEQRGEGSPTSADQAVAAEAALEPNVPPIDSSKESPTPQSQAYERLEFEWEAPRDDAGVVQDAVTLFERSLSAFVEHGLRHIHGDAWFRKGCGPYKERWAERATGATASPPTLRLGYAEIAELGEIIRAKQNWPVFRAHFSNKDWVENQFASIIPLRVEGFHPGARQIFAPEKAAGFAAMARVASCYHIATADAIEQLWSAEESDQSDPTSEVVPTSELILKNFDTLPRPRIFGRDAQLQELHEFWNDEFARCISITGRGGLGKTALVYEFVSDLLRIPVEPTKDAGLDLVIFLTAKQSWAEQDDQQRLPDSQRFGTLREALEATLEMFDVDALNDSLSQLRTNVLELARDNRCLFIFDNLETLDDDEIRAVALFCQQLPSPSKSVVTDRERRGVGIGASMTLPGLQREEALNLLDDRLTRTGAELLDRGRTELAQVVDELGGVPLYLHFLANLLTQGHTPREALQHVRGEDTLGLLRFSFESSLQRLPESALELLYYMSLKREPASRKELLRLSDARTDLNDDIGALQDAHFVEYAPGRDAVTFRVADRTLGEYVRLEAPNRMEVRAVSRLQQRAGVRSEFERQPNVERAIRQAADEASERALRTWADGIEYLEEKCVEFGDAPPLLGRLGYFHFRSHDTKAARPLLERALASDWEDALTLRTLGIINLWDRRLEEAQENAEAALNLHPESDQTKLLLGQVLMTRVEQSRFTLDSGRRLDIARRALSLIENSLIEDDYARWQRSHNERRARLLDRCELVVAGARRDL